MKRIGCFKAALTLLLFAVGIGVLLAPKIKKWKGKTHDR